MGSASLHLDTIGVAWRGLRHKLAPRQSARYGCHHAHSVWKSLTGRRAHVLMNGTLYCLGDCLERALSDELRAMRPGPKPATVAHRVPLGLLLLSRQQLSADQLRIALEAQRNAGYGRLGDWLLSLGFTTEQQITAALARQWSCPVLRINGPFPDPLHLPQVPLTLLESFLMIPVHHVKPTATLHIAFGEGIDYSALYALEKMTGCHTEACMALPSFIRARLQELVRHRGEREAVFECLTDPAEFSRIVRSYCFRIAAREIRLATFGPCVWVRLLQGPRPPIDLLFRAPNTSAGHQPSTPKVR